MDALNYPHVRVLLGLLDMLESIAQEQAKAACKRAANTRQPARGLAIKPGSATPLWNSLATQVTTRLHRRGDKTNLGRFLGLPRQRVHQLFVERSAVPDAERALLTLAWLHARLKNPRFA